MSGSPISGKHYPHKWLSYFEMMIEGKGKSLPKFALELEIHISTAFYWRHKILNAIRSIGHQQLQGIIESDETYVLESEKGKKCGIENRKSRKRDGILIISVLRLGWNGLMVSQLDIWITTYFGFVFWN